MRIDGLGDGGLGFRELLEICIIILLVGIFIILVITQ